MGRGNKVKISIGVKGNPQLSFGTGKLLNLDLEETSPDLKETIKTVKEKLLEEATCEDTRKIIKELYRTGATIGDGGTADAVRYELEHNTAVGGKSHIQKAKERINQIDKILKKNPNHPDKELLIKLKSDLEDALERR